MKKFHSIAALVFFTVATLIYTYPLVLLATDHLRDQGDMLQVVHVMAWFQHALLSGTSIFDINMYWPLTSTLTYIDSGISLMLLFIPINLITDNPIFSHNIVFLMLYILSGWGMYLLMFRWTGNTFAAIAAGLIFAFFPHKYPMVLHFLSIAWLPFIILGLETAIQAKKRVVGHAVLAVIAILMAALAAWYIALMVAIACLLYAAVLVRSKEEWKRIVGIGFASMVAVLPFALPYLREARHFSWDIGDVDIYSISIEKFLSPHSSLFVGFIVFVLLLAAIPQWKNRRVQFFFWVLVAAFLMTLGPSLHVFGLPTFIPLPYRLLYDLVPGVAGLRAVSRNFLLFMFAVAGLSAYGWVTIEAWLRKHHRKISMKAVFSVFLALFVLETFHTPLRPYARGINDFAPVRNLQYEISVPGKSVYEKLATLPAGPVLEVPVYSGIWWENAQYLYSSTLHWHPLVNGMGKTTPEFLQHVYEDSCSISDPATIRFWYDRGIRYIVFHASDYTRWGEDGDAHNCMIGTADEIKETLRTHADLIAEEDDVSLYALRE